MVYNMIGDDEFALDQLQQIHDTAVDTSTLDYGAPVLDLDVDVIYLDDDGSVDQEEQQEELE